MIDLQGISCPPAGALAAARKPLLEAHLQAEASLAASLAAQRDNLRTVGARRNDDLTGSRAMKRMLANERLAARGASLEAEMANLTRYQQACASSAQVIAALDKMLSMR